MLWMSNFFWKLHINHGLVLDKFMSSSQPWDGFKLFVYTFKPLDVRGTDASKTNRTTSRLSEALDLFNRFTDRLCFSWNIDAGAAVVLSYFLGGWTTQERKKKIAFL